MKSIILKSLTMTNWRGEQSRTTDFNAVSTTIAGEERGALQFLVRGDARLAQKLEDP